jgi:hypothetical protein
MSKMLRAAATNLQAVYSPEQYQLRNAGQPLQPRRRLGGVGLSGAYRTSANVFARYVNITVGDLALQEETAKS